MIESYKELLRSRLSDYRYHHSLCVADSAVELAERYGADKEKALVAGLLHDITKEADVSEHFELFAEGGVIPTELERVNRKLWHAMSGAEYIKLKQAFSYNIQPLLLIFLKLYFIISHLEYILTIQKFRN